MTWSRGLSLGIILWASLGWARPEVIFPSEAEVSNTEVISVFQVAELKEISGIAFSEIARLPLVEKTEGRDSVTLRRDEVSKKLRELVKNSDVLKKINPAFHIPEEIVIRIRRESLSKVEIERAVENLVGSQCAPCLLKMSLNALPLMKGPVWNIDWDQEIKPGSLMIPVREAGQFSNKWITGTLRVRKKVPVARRLIRFGERLQAEDLEIAESDITFQKEEAPELSQVVGLVAGRTLSPRTPVQLSDLKREPATRRGQMVKALVGEDGLEISINASSEENGFIGDTIKIKNPDTQKTMSATVIDKGVVKVQ